MLNFENKEKHPLGWCHRPGKGVVEGDIAGESSRCRSSLVRVTMVKGAVVVLLTGLVGRVVLPFAVDASA